MVKITTTYEGGLRCAATHGPSGTILPPDHPKRQLIEQAALTCPVHKSLHAEIDAAIEFVWAGVDAPQPS